MSTRTLVRNTLLSELHAMKNAGTGRVPMFQISRNWLSHEQTTRNNTYCVVMTDETRNAQTLQDDTYQMTGIVVMYAHDTQDARAVLDLMIEDAIDILRQALKSLIGVIQKGSIESITTTEASTAEGYSAQAVIRWSGVHRRPVVV